MFFDTPLYAIPTNVHTRWASPENFAAGKGAACQGNDGRKRSPCFPIKAGESKTLLDLKGTSGTIRRIWVTIDNRSPKMLRGLKIEIFWDGAETPAVSAPFGDFFSMGLGRMATFQSALFASPEGKSFNCYVPMPFHTGARMVVTNESDADLGAFYYDVDLTVGDDHPAEMAYLHTCWRRENPTTARRDYEILPHVAGRGRFLGSNSGVIANTQLYFKSWWGEGEVKVFLDGDTDHPTLCGTGTEDYIGTGWGQGQYASHYQGCHVADHDRFQYCFYRLHLPDPIWFHQDIRVAIQQIGCWDPQTIPQLHGTGLQLDLGGKPVDMAAAAKERRYGLYERQDDWSSCAWFYLGQAQRVLAPLAPVAERIQGL